MTVSDKGNYMKAKYLTVFKFLLFGFILMRNFCPEGKLQYIVPISVSVTPKTFVVGLFLTMLGRFQPFTVITESFTLGFAGVYFSHYFLTQCMT